MLLRLDPDRDLISLLSLPRDLLVSIPGVGYDKLNVAYTEGGPRLVLKTVRLLTGIEINEVVDVDFQGFADAVDSVGCVFVDVDREYFAPPEAGYAEIDINAGYQRLCGLKALQYVRYRHTDNDVVRAARQQAFLREARRRIGLGDLVLGGGGSELIDAFTENTRSTIDGADALRRIARSLFELRGAPVDQIRISGDLGPRDIRVESREVDRAVDRFLGTGGDFGAEPSDTDGSPGGRGGDGDGHPGEPVAADPQLARYAATAERRLGIPAFHPRRLPPGSAFSRDSRTYSYEDDEGRRQRAYKLVITRPHPQIATEHYGLAGTSWNDPPILRDPTEVRKIGGREYRLFYAGPTLRLVGWRAGGSSHWLSNSLLGSLSEEEMMTTATSVADA